MNCQTCNAHLEEGNKFCPECGTPVPEKKENICTGCGVELKPSQRFCTECGTPVVVKPVIPHCSSCGVELSVGVRFCPDCGAPTNKEEVIPPVTPIAPVENVQEYQRVEPILPTEPSIPAEQKRPARDSYRRPIITVGEDFEDEIEVSSPKTSYQPREYGQEATSQPLLDRNAARPSNPTYTGGVQGKTEEQIIAENNSEFVFEGHETNQPVPNVVVEPRKTEVPLAEKPAPEVIEASVNREVEPRIEMVRPVATIVTPAKEDRIEEKIREIEETPTIMEENEEELSKAEKKSAKKEEKKQKEGKKKNKAVFWVPFIILILIFLGALVYLLWPTIKERFPDLFSESISSEELPSEEESSISISSSSQEDASVPEIEVVEAVYTVPEGGYITELDILPIWEKVTSYDILNTARVTIASDSKNNMGLIDAEGRYILKPGYMDIGDFTAEGRAFFVKDGKYGFLDDSVGELIEPKYDSANDFSEGLAVVKLNEKYGYINVAGEEVIPLELDFADDFKEGYAVVKKEGATYYIDITGQKVSEDYEDARSFSQSFAAVAKDGKWGYINAAFEQSIDFKYDKAEPFYHGKAIVAKEGKQFLIDWTDEMCSPEVDEILPASETGFYTVLKEKTYGFVDGSSTNFMIDPIYYEAKTFVNGLAPVSSNNGIWYYIDKAKTPLFTENLDEAMEFSNGLAGVRVGEEYFIIDVEGQFIDTNRWEGVGQYTNGRIPVKKDGKWGYLKIVENHDSVEIPSSKEGSSEEASIVEESSTKG